MKKITLIAGLLTLLTACTKNLTDLNVDPKHPVTVPSYTLFTESERLLSNAVNTTGSSTNIFRLIEQQWTETTYLNETEYQLSYRRQPDGIWTTFYVNVIANLEKTKSLAATDVTDAATQKDDIAIADMLEVYSYYYLVTTFGNVPYSQAENFNNQFPAYDDAKAIYASLLTRLKADIAALSGTSTSWGAADQVYGGNTVAWKKFGNSFLLKMAITMSDYDSANAQANVTAAISGGIFTSNSDNALFAYVSSPPNNNPAWNDLVQSQRHDYVATTEFLNLLYPNTANQDPRTPYYYALATNTGTYVGAPNGSGAGALSFPSYSLPSGPLLTPGSVGTLSNPDFPGDMLDYSETEFNLAEAIARGYTTGSVANEYNNAITASITYWGGTAAQAASYLLQPGVAFATASNPSDPTTVLGNFRKIALQEYISLYNRGWDAWIVNRRLDYPVLVAPVNATLAAGQTGPPVRFTYPISEQNINNPNYTKASTAIGGDLTNTLLFFDKYTPANNPNH